MLSKQWSIECPFNINRSALKRFGIVIIKRYGGANNAYLLWEW